MQQPTTTTASTYPQPQQQQQQQQPAAAPRPPPPPPPSLLTPIGGDCGYCKGEESSASYYARTSSLCPQHYQDLMDRGWRRSGSLLYLPDVSRSCCPHYTIRLSAHEFQATRDQRQALHRWNRFVLGDEYIKKVAMKYPKTKEEKKKQNNTFDLITTIHESEYTNLKPSLEPAHRFEVALEPDIFTEEKYALFDNYQRHVHHESDADISRTGFRRFLCNSPIQRQAPSTSSSDPAATPPKLIGSYHQTYRLDGRLIAMSVLDLLPHAVSGVYFVYHSDFSAHAFGKLSALREAALAVEARHDLYYMGYFIRSCKKMAYKGDYRPQQVLDYDTGEWHVMDDRMRDLMDRRPWVSMSRESQIVATLAEHNNNNNTNNASTSSTATNTTTTTDPQITESTLATLAYGTLHPQPLSAISSNLSLLTLGLPGALTLPKLEREINLDTIKVSLSRGGGTIHEMQDLVAWGESDVLDPAGIRGCVAELAACVGGKLVNSGSVVVDLSR